MLAEHAHQRRRRRARVSWLVRRDSQQRGRERTLLGRGQRGSRLVERRADNVREHRVGEPGLALRRPSPQHTIRTHFCEANGLKPDGRLPRPPPRPEAAALASRARSNRERPTRPRPSRSRPITAPPDPRSLRSREQATPNALRRPSPALPNQRSLCAWRTPNRLDGISGTPSGSWFAQRRRISPRDPGGAARGPPAPGRRSCRSCTPAARAP